MPHCGPGVARGHGSCARMCGGLQQEARSPPAGGQVRLEAEPGGSRESPSLGRSVWEGAFCYPCPIQTGFESYHHSYH